VAPRDQFYRRPARAVRRALQGVDHSAARPDDFVNDIPNGIVLAIGNEKEDGLVEKLLSLIMIRREQLQVHRPRRFGGRQNDVAKKPSCLDWSRSAGP